MGKSIGLSAFSLKLIAMVSMVCDHVGALFFPEQIVFSLFGRLAFPIYCFLLVNGFFHTRSRGRYLGRLAILAAISQIPYGIMVWSVSNPSPELMWQQPSMIVSRLNALVILSLGLLSLICLDYLRNRFGAAGHGAGLLLAAGLTVFADQIHCEYAFLGIPLIVAFYEGRLLRETNAKRSPAVFLLLGTSALALYCFLRIFLDTMEISATLLEGAFQFLALLLLLSYNGVPGRKNKWIQYGFYLFYPVHLLVLDGIPFLL